MKIQYLAVIFVIIVLPISLVISLYTGNLIKVSNTEASYNRILFNATHDAIRTYQMNTLDNTYAAEDTSKFRDVNASINSFYNNLGTGLSRSGYSKEELYDYVPAILFNLYDGYYMYGPYQNIAVQNGEKQEDYAYVKIKSKREAEKGPNGGNFVSANDLDYYNRSSVLTNEPEFGLQNYNYYACEYKGKTRDGSADYDIVINYTLDNFIRIYGYVGDKFYNYEGYYIYTAGISGYDPNNTSLNYIWKIVKDGGAGASETVEIAPEMLGEYVAYYDPYTVYYHRNGTGGGYTQRVIYQKNGHKGIGYFNYIVYNGVKYYLDFEHLKTKNATTIDMDVADGKAGGSPIDINLGSAGENGYKTDKFQFLERYRLTGEDDNAKELITQYNVSFNNTYVGIPIFKTDGKQRIYISKSELGDIIEYMNGYYGGLVFNSNEGGLDRSIDNFINNVDTYFRDLNDVYYYTNAYKFSKAVNDHIFSKINLNLNPLSDNYSVVSDAYNTKYTAYFEFDEQEGKGDSDDERYYLHEKYDYANKTTNGGNGNTYVFNSWGLDISEANTTTIDLVDPDLDTSLFNQHRIDVITSCIEYSFSNAVENFNEYMQKSYKYKVPDISETDWGRICNNISCLTIMQGMPIGNFKFFNNYSIVVDNKVNEFTPKSGIYVEDNYQLELGSSNVSDDIPTNLRFSAPVDPSDNTNYVYKTGKYTVGGTSRDVVFHNPGCSDYSKEVDAANKNVMGYRIIDYDIDSYQPTADLKGYLTYKAGGQDHPNGTGSETPENWTPEGANQNGKQVFFYLRPGTGCYECVISQNKLDFSIDDILSFKSEVTLQTGGTPLPISNRVRQAYMRALARERGAKSRFSSNTSGIKGFGN